ncbi:Protein serrate [Frankliniella fusca]|uniref:Protein serrate n=1 Tax=Frankliniella fusca TaxID=407009 RepID=A0AAE1LA58_9NEOP|nr:Protein serrate [Frankliniella fusca]
MRPPAASSGFFELQLLEINNPRSEVRGGACCGAGGGTGGGTGGGARYELLGPCSGPCHTRLRLCLKEYQNNVTSTGSCSFGNATSPVLGGATFALETDPDQDPEAAAHAKLVIPFAFRWTVSTE